MRLRNLTIMVLLLSLSLFECAYYNTFYNAKKFYRSASKARKERLRTQVVELSPEEKARLKRRGQYLGLDSSRPSSKEMQDYQKAIEKASKVLEFYPKSKYVDDALMLLGECFYYRREYSKAQRKFEEIIELYPESEFIPRARLFMAKTMLGLRKFDEAEQMFHDMSTNEKLGKDIREEAAYELAGLYYEKEEYELAADEYRMTSKKSKDKLIRAMSLYRLGECLLKLENYSGAVKVFKRAVKASPNEDFKSQAMFKLGQAQSLSKDYKAAIKTYSDLLSKEFDKKRIPRVKFQLAENLRKNGNLEEALKWYNDIIEQHKRTDASAKSYFALGEIEEFVNGNYKKAKENYDMVRGEFANSTVAPDAKERSNNIKALLELEDAIARLEGRAVASDSAAGGGKEAANKGDVKDDAPIDLTMDGMWVNYAGRDRPPPITLRDLTEADRERAALSQSRLKAAGNDSTAARGAALQSVELDSAALAKKAEEEKKQKMLDLAQKRLALAELLLFNFNKPDSAADLYLQIIENDVDSSLSARAMFSLGYIFRDIKHDTTISDSIYLKLIELYPDSPQAYGAKKFLGLPVVNVKVDSAEIIYERAEKAFWDDEDLDKALGLYESIIQTYPESRYAPKAEFALGWLYENRLYDYDLAAEHYQNIIKNHPDSPFAKSIKRKLDAVERVKKQEEAKRKAREDSLAKIAAKKDSLATAAADTSGGREEHLNPQISDSSRVSPPSKKKEPPPASSAKTGKPGAPGTTARTVKEPQQKAGQAEPSAKRSAQPPPTLAPAQTKMDTVKGKSTKPAAKAFPQSKDQKAGAPASPKPAKSTKPEPAKKPANTSGKSEGGN